MVNKFLDLTAHLTQKIMKKLTFILILLISLVSSLKVQASHILGGEVSFECVGGGNYVFTVIVYRDCSGIPFANSIINLTNNAGLGIIQCNLISTVEITPICTPSFGQNQLNCSDTILSRRVGAVNKFTFRSQPISFAGVAPPPANGYTFNTIAGQNANLGQIACCRNSLANMALGGCNNIVLRAKMHRYLSVPTNLLSGVPPALLCDASPAFAEPPTSIQIQSLLDTTSFNNNAIDPNLDSLAYGIETPWSDSGENCIFAGTYNVNNPFAGIIPATGNGGGGPINTETGVINFIPIQAGNWQACIVVKSYRCGQLIAEVFRDFQLQVLLPPIGYPIGIQQRPFLDKPFLKCNTGEPTYEATYYAGDNIDFLIQAYDFNPAFPAQNLKIYFNGSLFGTNYSSTTGCLFPPCATISGYPGSPQAGLPPDPIIVRGDTVGRGYNFTYQTGARFNWNTACENIPVNACGASVTRYNFTVTAVDDQCPVNGKTIEAISITLLPTPKIPSGEIKCVSVLPNGHVKLDFIDNINYTEPDEVDLCNYGGDSSLAANATISRLLNSFKKHNIYRATNPNGPWILVDSVQTYVPFGTLNTFTDQGVNAQDSIYYYSIRTLSGCDGLLSQAGDTVSTMKINASYAPYNVSLNWNSISNPLPDSTGNHYILDSTLVNGGFSFASSFDSTLVPKSTYENYLFLCDDTVYYRVKLPNEYGCVSISAVDSIIYKDEVPPLTQEITLVSVDTTTNPQEVFLYWNQNADSTTISYDVYENIPGGASILITLPSRSDTSYLTSLSSNSINYLSVAARDTCENLGLMGDIQNNMVLKTNMDKCKSQIEVNWNRYYNMQGGLKEYRLMRSENGNPFVHIATFSQNDDTTYFDSNLIQDDYYCYAIWAVNEADTNLIANSNMECIVADVIKVSEFLYLRYATVNEISQQVELRLLTDTIADVERYAVLRSDDGTNFSQIGSFLPQSGINDYTFTDADAKTAERSYYYKIQAIDICGVPNVETNLGRTILLSARADFNFFNALSWNFYEAFSANVENYIVRRSIPSDPVLAPYADVSILASTANSNNDPVEDFTNNTGSYCYIIQAVEGMGNSFGFKDVSNSNEVCVTQMPRIYIPTAFVPLGVNKEFTPKGIFIYPTTGYELKIFNRWGEEVFQSLDLYKGWDGFKNGELAQAGVYLYTLSFVGYDNVVYTQKGSLKLIR